MDYFSMKCILVEEFNSDTAEKWTTRGQSNSYMLRRSECKITVLLFHQPACVNLVCTIIMETEICNSIWIVKGRFRP